MNRTTAAALITALTAAALWLMQITHPATAYGAEPVLQAPELTAAIAGTWPGNPVPWPQSTPPVERSGKVLLVDFQNVDCRDCPPRWLKKLQGRYGRQGLEVVGVYAPEVDLRVDPPFEPRMDAASRQARIRAWIIARVAAFDLEHPELLDPSASYWSALVTGFGATYYLLDKHGRVRARFSGPLRADGRRAQDLELAIARLLAQPS